MSRVRGILTNPFFAAVRRTASANILQLIAGAFGGLILARVLGPAGRGEYAALFAWYSVATVGETGITTAICYNVARYGGREGDFLRTGQWLLGGLSLVVAAVGVGLSAGLVPSHHGIKVSYLTVFAAMPLIFVGGSWTFALQAKDLKHWNESRVVQPMAYLLAVLSLAVTHSATLVTVTVVLLSSIALQAVWSALRWRQLRLPRGRASVRAAREMFTFGTNAAAARIPYVINSRIDQLVLSLAVPARELGQYALAVSVSMLAFPLASAFGYVALPRIASGAGRKRGTIERQALLGALATATVVLIPVGALASVLVPWIFGDGYRGSVAMVWILTPGGIALTCNQVMGDLLRGHDRAFAAARSEATGAIVTVLLLGAFVPTLGARGAAITSSCAYFVSFAFLLRNLRRVVAGESDPSVDGRAVGGQVPTEMTIAGAISPTTTSGDTYVD
jgi:O-antigen/teichoic acid export membrane protein